jgi:hypothetical protein
VAARVGPGVSAGMAWGCHSYDDGAGFGLGDAFYVVRPTTSNPPLRQVGRDRAVALPDDDLHGRETDQVLGKGLLDA